LAVDPALPLGRGAPWNNQGQRDAWLASREPWESLFAAVAAVWRMLPTPTDDRGIPAEDATPVREACLLALRHALAGDVPAERIRATRERFTADQTSWNRRSWRGGVAAVDLLGAASHMLPNPDGPPEFAQREAARKTAQFAALSLVMAAWPRGMTTPAEAGQESLAQNAVVARFVAIADPRRTRLRIANTLLGERGSPAAMISACEAWGDTMIVACDLISERGWTDGAVAELRSLLGEPPPRA
jgi:hypothetical protein